MTGIRLEPGKIFHKDGFPAARKAGNGNDDIWGAHKPCFHLPPQPFHPGYPFKSADVRHCNFPLS